MKWFLKALRQYFDFKGRARRKEFWMFYLFYAIFFVTTRILDDMLGLIIFGVLHISIVFGLFLPLLTVSVRRMHDIGKGGWWYLILLIPMVHFILASKFIDIGNTEWLSSHLVSLIQTIYNIIVTFCSIIVLVWWCTNGQPGENKWGVNPKEEIGTF